MKKIIIYTSIVILIIAVTAGATYAYFSSSTTRNNMSGGTTQIDVVYTNGNVIDGEINLSETKEEGYNTTVYIRQTNSSVPVEANIYIDIDEISQGLSSLGFIWEVYDEDGEKLTEGDFWDCEGRNTTKKCADGDRMYLVRDYPLTTNDAGFTIYFWLNGDLVGNEVIGATFHGEIGAITNIVTGELQ